MKLDDIKETFDKWLNEEIEGRKEEMKNHMLESKGQMKQLRNELGRTKDFMTNENLKHSDFLKENLWISSSEYQQKLKEQSDELKQWFDRSV